MIVAPIHELVRSLNVELAKPRPSGRLVAELLSTYAAAHDDWQEFALASPSCYTRNLVEKNEHYELLVLCWDRDQRSPIHNHEGQDCWMAVLDGPIEEVHFEMPSCEGPLNQGPVRRFETGQVAYISDEIALHEVRAGQDRAAVSLHLYARPYGECNCYCERTGRVTRVPLYYHSVGGVLTGETQC